MAAPDKIKELVARFERLAAGPAPESFDEAQLRVSFVNPFWEALGWNVREPGEVIIEKRVAVRAATKHADYCFQLGGKPQFVVEAKDYFRHRSLDDRDIIFQAKRYGYNLPADFAVLTNFGELRVYDAGLEPIYENPARGFLKKLRFGWRDYVPRWDELAAAFSRDAVAAGALRALLPKARRTRNKEALDRKFFERLNEWRKELARVIALRNADLSVHDINEAVQRILDRAIFIRVIEDRGIEATELLRAALNKWKDEKEKPLYQYVVDKFRYLEPQYNGELFYPHFSENLLVDDRPLRAFLESLYYPKCPYQFNVVGVELLGTVYERFLGSTIRLTKTHRAVVEEKPEVRKAGGVYYTPKYIVDYIVANTVGELLKKCKTPGDVAKLKILDPACGSGSFLLGAFQRLIDWHEEYFNAHPDKIGRGLAAACWLDDDGAAASRYRLTAKFKGRVLLNNIFGVDIDPQACEVTRMSLYLRVLEEVRAQYLIKTALLPPLDANVKCGNSLIGSDYFDGNGGQTLMSVPQEERRRVNPFDWDVEFEEIMKAGGFDAVIGNPPYSAKQSLETKNVAKFFSYVEYKCDPYALFVEQGWYKLREGGYLGMIVPVTWMTNYYYSKFREFFVSTKSLYKVVLIDGLVFPEANVDTSLLFLRKCAVKDRSFEWIKGKPDDIPKKGYRREYGEMEAEERYDIVPDFDPEWNAIKGKIDSLSIKLKSVTKISLGMKLKSNEDFVTDSESERNPDGIYFGKDVKRYGTLKPVRFFNYDKAIIVGGTKNPAIQTANPKILLQAIRNLSLKRRIVASLETDGLYFIGTLNSIVKLENAYDIKYILGFVNSTLANTYFAKRFTTISLTAFFLGVLPVYEIDFSDPADGAKHDLMVNLVDEMLDLHKRLNAAKSDADKDLLARAIKVTDKKIDKLVYELYGLTVEEIRVVEGS